MTGAAPVGWLRAMYEMYYVQSVGQGGRDSEWGWKSTLRKIEEEGGSWGGGEHIVYRERVC